MRRGVSRILGSSSCAKRVPQRPKPAQAKGRLILVSAPTIADRVGQVNSRVGLQGQPLFPCVTACNQLKINWFFQPLAVDAEDLL
jgi:hypothetical protein